ncbi:MAG: DegV family protein [Actinomycetota bacterium]|nr:DegV family protein [Actinomycetota bacterium]
MIGICTDSNSQLPPALAERYGIEVVPLTVVVDDREYLEGVTLDADEFYAMYTPGHCPAVSTSLPSPGQFAAAYDDLLARGCTEILSIHVSAAVSGTLNAARLAAHSLPAPVRLVDSGTASFGISCCVWAAAAAIAEGATLDQAATVAEQLSPHIGNVFVVGALDHLRRSGRVGDPAHAAGLPVLTLKDGAVDVVAVAETMLDAINAMANFAVGWGDHVRVAIGHSDAATEPLAEGLQEAVGEAASVVEVVRYRVGPSVGVHTGPGTVGCFVFPAAVS